MPNRLIGRGREKALLEKLAQSDKPEFVAIYGRRRVGKTFLVNQVFTGRMTFSMTGVLEGDRRAQMHTFMDAMDLCGHPLAKPPADWYEAFQLLRHYLSAWMNETDAPAIVFIDELPCLDTRGSDFTSALGYFWNSWASLQPRMLLIVCGSATSWMMKNVIDSHGGLHDRITHEIHLREFTLSETEMFLHAFAFPWDRLTLAQAYMAFGGIPYYLSLLEPSESLAQNIDRLCFRPDGEMRREFHRLYKTLFSTPDPYIAIVEALFRQKHGMSRDEIAKSIGKDANGRLTQMLQNLVDCDILRFYHTKQKKVSARGGIYQLTDFYSIFYLQFVKNGSTDEHFWTKSIGTPTLSTWLGLSFERLCMAHIPQIKQALHIDTIKTEHYAWRSSDPLQKAQIDLVIERADRMVNIFDAKYSERPYLLGKSEYERLQRRIALYQQQTAPKAGIIPTVITSSGLQRNAYSEHIICQLLLDDLFG